MGRKLLATKTTQPAKPYAPDLRILSECVMQSNDEDMRLPQKPNMERTRHVEVCSRRYAELPSGGLSSSRCWSLGVS